MGENKTISRIIPVLLAFFVMGFVDLIGITTNYVKQDFALSDTAANAFSVMLFVWFFVFSIPTGLLMNRIGRKKTVLLSMLVTLVAMMIPFVSYGKVSMLVAVSFLGIGNTLMQVSLNPLIANLVAPEKQASVLTLGQFIKAIASFLGPILAVQAAVHLGDWRYLFVAFAVVNLAALLYLHFTDIRENDEKKDVSSFSECLKLLGKGSVLLLFIGILMHVGIDTGINITAPKLLQERTGMPLESAAYVTSIYFLLRTAGCLAGTFIMSKYSPVRFFIVSVLIILLGIAGLLLFKKTILLYICVGLVGFGNSNVFSIIFSGALQTMPDKNNEISALMVMGISGGGLIPLIMGAASDSVSTQAGAVIVLAVCAIYLLLLSSRLNKIYSA